MGVGKSRLKAAQLEGVLSKMLLSSSSVRSSSAEEHALMEQKDGLRLTGESD